MPTSDEPFFRQQVAATVSLVAGVLLIGASFFTATLPGGRLSWTDEQALEYQAASANLHRLSHEIEEASAGNTGDALRRELTQAREEYGRLRGDLDAARGRPARTATILRLAGVVLTIAGTAAMAWLRGR